MKCLPLDVLMVKYCSTITVVIITTIIDNRLHFSCGKYKGNVVHVNGVQHNLLVSREKPNTAPSLTLRSWWKKAFYPV